MKIVEKENGYLGHGFGHSNQKSNTDIWLDFWQEWRAGQTFSSYAHQEETQSYHSSP